MKPAVDRSLLIKKWSDASLGEFSVKDEKDFQVVNEMVQLLENQANTVDGIRLPGILNEAGYATSLSNLGGNADGVSNSAAYQFKNISLALVRRTFPELFANKCVGVQAMAGPVGLAYAMRFVYQTADHTFGNPYVEAGWDKVADYSGYTGTSAGVSGLPVGSGTGEVAATAEAWQMGTNFPQISTKFDNVTITAKTRQVGSSISIESQQDVQAMHGIDLKRQLVEMLQYEILAELDRELVYLMQATAIDTANGGEAAVSVDCSGTNMDGRWSQEKYANIVTAIVQASEKIAKATKQGPGNFAICSPAIVTALQASGHPFSQLTTSVNGSNISAQVGVLNGTIAIYRDFYATSDYALVGYKGPDNTRAGIIYCPYVTGAVATAVSPTDFATLYGVKSRYALVNNLLGAGRYYRLINFTNVNQILIGA